MKPLCLVVQAFGPYADVQVFDFRDLGNHTFFLIHGDTGSGKSTILDAICYALYGDSSGGERTGLQLRSHHAPPARRTTVQFDFAIGCHRYRVTRAPEYERPKHRGIGTVTDQQIARLWLRNGCEDDDEPGEILAERWEQVSRRVIELLGFECNQFRQVVVLPQGQFRDFLIAPSGEREAILSFLFKTHEFQAIERALKDAANRMKRDHDHQSQRLTDLYQRAAVKDLAALQQERAQRVIDLDAIKEQLGVLRTVADDAQRHLQEGQETQRKLNERALAEQNTAELDAQQPEVDAQRIELNQGHRAAALADIEAAAVQRHAEALQADQERDQARQRYNNALAVRDQVREALTLAEQREPEIEQSRKQLAQLHEIAQRTHALEEACAKLASAEQHIQVLAKQRLDVVGALGVAEVTLQSHDQSAAQNREVAAQGEARQLRFEQVQRLHEQRERLDVVLAALAAAEQDAHTAAELHDNTVVAYAESQQRFEQSEQAWYAGQAG